MFWRLAINIKANCYLIRLKSQQRRGLSGRFLMISYQ